jgi:hypothetical protein
LTYSNRYSLTLVLWLVRLTILLTLAVLALLP